MKNRKLTEVMADLQKFETANKLADYKNQETAYLTRKALMRELWYDWFCRESSLKGKTIPLLKKLRAVIKANNGRFNPETCYTFLKNNCPCVGSLYDDFRICDIESGDVLYTVTPKCGHDYAKGNAQLWGRDNDFKEPLVNGTWRDVIAYFANN